jgi:homocitrate synthase NifV
VLKVPDAFEPFPPEAVGAERAIVIGKHSGSGAIQHVLASEGIEVDRGDLAELTEAVRYAAVQAKRPLRADETVGLYRSLHDGAVGGAHRR